MKIKQVVEDYFLVKVLYADQSGWGTYSFTTYAYATAFAHDMVRGGDVLTVQVFKVVDDDEDNPIQMWW